MNTKLAYNDKSQYKIAVANIYSHSVASYNRVAILIDVYALSLGRSVHVLGTLSCVYITKPAQA